MLKRAINSAWVILLASLMMACEPSNGAAKGPPATSNPPLAKHVVIISIDGCRPDVMLRADAPNIRQLMDEGSFTMWARTTTWAITLPSHVSMVTGVTPERHGVTWNTDLPPSQQAYPLVPTIFDLAKKAGMTTGLAAGKTKFITLARPGSVDYLWLPEVSTGDNQQVAVAAGKIIRMYKPNVMFVHFASVDIVGHAIGWGTPEQVASVEDADIAVGIVVKAVKDAELWGQTLIIVTADHGGAGISHGPNDPRSRHIPWIAVGPNVRENFDLTRYPNLVVDTEDTFATSLYFLGLPIPADLDGKPVLAVLQERELLQ